MPKTQNIIPCSQAQAPFFVGIDLGGTSIKIGVVDNLGQTVGYSTIPTLPELGAEAACERMAQTTKQLIAEIGAEPVVGVGLGSPGLMDIPQGVLIFPNNLPGWDNFPLRDRAAHHLGLPVTFNNDANAAAFAESWIGSGQQLHSMILLTLGTGVGSGIIIGDIAIQGEHSHGAEVGHLIIDCRDDARRCTCGHLGHLEAYASATAVIKRTQEALDAGRASSLQARVAAGQSVTSLMVAEEAEAGDPLALEIVMDTAKFLGVGIVSLMTTFDPSGIILGGAMNFGGNETELGRKFLARVIEEVQLRAFPIPAQNIIIDFATLGGDAGYLGAAGLARAAAKQPPANS